MERSASAGKKILIVDDDANHVLLLEKRLEAAGYQTVAAADGMEGLRQAVEHHPALIITDVLLPKLNGFQLTEQLKSNPSTSNIPVIMMSAVYVTDEDMARGFELGAETYVSKADLAMRKPLQTETLLDAVASLLAKPEPLPEQAEPARILVVDDKPETLQLIVRQLQSEGYRLETAADGREAIDKVLAAPFDLVLLDVKLPGIDGLEVLTRIKERHPGMAVVMMTGYGSEEIAAEALRRGADDYIIKPLDAKSTREAVNGTIARVRRNSRTERVAARLRSAASPELENKERLIEELRGSSIKLMEQYDRLLAAEEQNRNYSERLEQMVDERARDLKRRSDELAILHSVLSAATHSLDLSEVFGVMLRELKKMLGTEAAAAFVIDPETGRLRLGGQQNMPAEFLRWVSRSPGGDGVIAAVMETGGGRLISNLSDPELQGFFAGLPEGSRMVLFPMNSPNETVGLVAGICVDCEIDESTWRLLDSIGDELGVVVDNVRLYDNLRQAYLSTIRALAEAVDARDAHTRGHSDRVSAFAVAAARRMGLDEDAVLAIRDAGYLHDVGKIGTPDAVLLKQGSLNEEERRTMRQHPGTSHKILQHASIPEEIKVMIRHHHERFDGEGYPDGLSGSDIPIGSRILCVADAFEAMTSDRPYRASMSGGAAAAELKRCAGSQFDPAVVDIFLEVVEAGDGGTDQPASPYSGRRQVENM